MNIIKSRQESREFWLKNRDSKLESVYAKIAPNIPLLNITNKEKFLDRCEVFFKEFVENNSDTQSIERWDKYEIERMFGKGLNPTSLKTALNDIDFLIKNLSPEREFVRVLEFGPGSGWSTIMLYNQLKKAFPEKRIELYSVDISPHSLVATENSLDYYQIPWQTLSNIGNFADISISEGEVNLILDDFVGILSKADDNYFDGFFSSHGTAYLSDSEYSKLLSSLAKKGVNNSVFVCDSLDPLYTVKLRTTHLVRCSINPSRAGKMKEYYYGKSLVSNSKYFPGQEVKKLVVVNNEESFYFYNWNNYLLKHFRFGYMLQMLKSMRITTDVIEEYREDVFPSYLLKGMVEKQNLSNNIVEIEGKPKPPLYISNAAFVIRK